jgi:DNA primase
MGLSESIEKYNEYTKQLTEYTNELYERSDKSRLAEFAEIRGFSMEQIEESGIFYVNNAVEMLIPEYIDRLEDFGVISEVNRRPIFYNRFIIPIRDTNGNILNLVGYSKEANERYMYGKAKYYKRGEDMYGQENLKLAYELGYAIITEGITDAMRVRELGYKNCFARCGTHDSYEIWQKLNRCRHGVIQINDRDSAGQKASRNNRLNRAISLNTYIRYKDVDEMCLEFRDVVKEYIDACVEWILNDEHRGIRTSQEVVTMMI